jgi:hypothetical protein
MMVMMMLIIIVMMMLVVVVVILVFLLTIRGGRFVLRRRVARVNDGLKTRWIRWRRRRRGLLECDDTLFVVINCVPETEICADVVDEHSVEWVHRLEAVVVQPYF